MWMGMVPNKARGPLRSFRSQLVSSYTPKDSIGIISIHCYLIGHIRFHVGVLFPTRTVYKDRLPNICFKDVPKVYHIDQLAYPSAFKRSIVCKTIMHQ